MMEITIVRSLNGDEIHGTDNGKKTGCGINLLKNASKYVQKGKMTDLKELTCEKCKTNLAKKIIKADKKEMARIIKEERARAKKGIEDEGIVPLGNTEAKITSAPEKNVPVEETPAVPVQPQSAPASAKGTIPGTGVAIDSELAAFAINVPKQENEAPEHQESPEDDFLAQFAISKPQEQEEEIQPENQSSAPPQSGIVKDDFLAQFAIPSPGVQAENVPAGKIDEQPETFEETAENPDESEEFSYEMDDFTSEPETTSYEMDDFTSEPEATSYEMDDFTSEPEATSYEMDDFTSEPETTSYEMDDFTSEPETTSYEMDDFTSEPKKCADNISDDKSADTADTADDVISDEDLIKMFSIMSENDRVGSVEVLPQNTSDESSIYDNDENVVDIEANDVTEDEAEINTDEVSDNGLSEWDVIANSLFGSSEETPVEPEPMPEPVEPEPMPEIETPVESEPMPEIETPVEPEPMPEIETPVEPEPMPEIETPVESEPMPEIETPVESEPMPEIETPVEPEPMPEIETPVEPEPMPEIETPVEPEPMPEIAAPINNTNEAVPPVQPIPTPQTTAPMPGQSMPEQPIVVPVPQFAGYDMNGQPVYTYVQSQFVGYDPNGQPIFVPLQQPVSAAPVQPAPMAQPTAASVQSAPMAQPTAASVQSAPMAQLTAASVQSASMAQPTAASVQSASMVQPTAASVQSAPYQQNSSGSRVNISKIADEKPKAMPKTFANAVANSRAKSQQNIFDMQGAQMPVLDSIEDILSSMGDDSVKKKKSEEKAVPVFEEYKAPVRTASSAPKPAASKPAEPERPLTKAELKAKKKQEKIDQKFKKDLAKRGF